MVAKGDFGKYEVGLFLAIFGIFGVISSLIGLIGGIIVKKPTVCNFAEPDQSLNLLPML
jgi:hypothetical protein